MCIHLDFRRRLPTRSPVIKFSQQYDNNTDLCGRKLLRISSV